ncbi:CDP-glucose 4,6-dehydratase [Sphingomonas sp. CFBP 13603]|uniref:CDP-glucose 4,6-dehydratase n=1 Tax=Sphingomonas sp. CFBP 13603 TaxID=2774040 RepID=UPI0018691391|nr:CDP-glucose 4,6-dehydratase [Sphingomonas sp. CFBP 13603]MBE2992957.1 CDP-glucose 4,6-dehydratase [Sphingomonas sp. CFBP 13603]
MGKRTTALEDMVSADGQLDPGFWRGRRVFLTGHTGFKGAWTALWLSRLGAHVHGYALSPETDPALWSLLGDDLLAGETIADITDRSALAAAIDAGRPEIVLHLAAQALVRRSYADPLATIASNTMGTAYLLDVLRNVQGLAAVVIVTTDKVYANNDGGRDFVEDDPLGGHDPYSASKAAAELLTRSFAASYFDNAGVPVATARAGNVIGGGDWSADRLIPDIWRAMQADRPLLLRYPDATRPWQHVLEPIRGYLLHAQALARDPATPRAINFGPVPGAAMTVAQVADTMTAAMQVTRAWQCDDGDHPPEMKLLSLDPALARHALGWRPRLDDAAGVAWTARWYSDFAGGADARALCEAQIDQYEALP